MKWVHTRRLAFEGEGLASCQGGSFLIVRVFWHFTVNMALPYLLT